jgi:type I restriction enzyme S subunit
MTTGLPEGWATIRVGDYFHSWGGMTPSTSNASYWGGKVPWVSSKDIKAWRIAGGEEFITRKALQETRLRLCPVGSVLVVVRSGILAHTLPIAVVDAPVTINQDLKAFYCPDSDLNAWLALALRSLTPEILTNNRKDGTTVQSVRYEELCDLIIQVPPSHEQKRITARLGNLLERVGSTRERLSRVPVILKRFRQAVLTAACSGRLTEDWRQGAGSRYSAKITRPQPIAEDAQEGLPEIPESWCWTPIGEVSEIRGGIQKQPKRTPKKHAFPYLRVANVLRGRLDLSQVKQMELFEGELETYRLKTGDLLVVEGNGSLTEIGRSAIWGGEIENCVHQNHIIRVRVRGCIPEYVDAFWNSRFGTSIITARAVTTSGLYSLSTKKVAAIPLPLPPLEEQREIMHRTDALLRLADAVEERVSVATSRADKLTHSALAKAFRGELVPTEAELAQRDGTEYEPASVLLERIKKKRNSETPSKATR